MVAFSSAAVDRPIRKYSGLLQGTMNDGSLRVPSSIDAPGRQTQSEATDPLTGWRGCMAAVAADQTFLANDR